MHSSFVSTIFYNFVLLLKVGSFQAIIKNNLKFVLPIDISFFWHVSDFIAFDFNLCTVCMSPT